MVSTPTASLAVDGSAEASSPEAEAFCAAEIAAEQAFASEDPALIGQAVETLLASAPADIAPTVQEVIDNGEAEGPAFEVPYAAVLDWMRANCGFAALDVAASDYAYGGLPTELPAGPIIIKLQNIGEEVHELALMRVNDDVTLTVEEILELPEEESMTMTTMAGMAFAFPGTAGQTVIDLTPGRYVALCFLPEGATPEIISELSGPEDTSPAALELRENPPHFALGMIQEITVS